MFLTTQYFIKVFLYKANGNIVILNFKDFLSLIINFRYHKSKKV